MYRTLIISILLLGCQSEQPSEGVSSEINHDTTLTLSQENYNVNSTFVFIDFPIPILDSIFPFNETSGIIEKSPSHRYYNPVDTGIFVFYTLFDKSSDPKHPFELVNIGTLTTHTYRKPKYGWSESDKDQTFIYLETHAPTLRIGKSIRVGGTIREVKMELGEPIYQSDTSFIFLGKNKVAGSFNVKNGQITSFSYGRYNFPDDIFEIDSMSRVNLITEKLKRQ